MILGILPFAALNETESIYFDELTLGKRIPIDQFDLNERRLLNKYPSLFFLLSANEFFLLFQLDQIILIFTRRYFLLLLIIILLLGCASNIAIFLLLSIESFIVVGTWHNFFLLFLLLPLWIPTSSRIRIILALVSIVLGWLSPTLR